MTFYLGYRNDGSYIYLVMYSNYTTACLPVLLVSLVSLSKNASLLQNGLLGNRLESLKEALLSFAGAKVRQLFHSCKLFSNFFEEKITNVDECQKARARTF